MLYPPLNCSGLLAVSLRSLLRGLPEPVLDPAPLEGTTLLTRLSGSLLQYILLKVGVSERILVLRAFNSELRAY